MIGISFGKNTVFPHINIICKEIATACSRILFSTAVYQRLSNTKTHKLCLSFGCCFACIKYHCHNAYSVISHCKNKLKLTHRYDEFSQLRNWKFNQQKLSLHNAWMLASLCGLIRPDSATFELLPWFLIVSHTNKKKYATNIDTLQDQQINDKAAPRRIIYCHSSQTNYMLLDHYNAMIYIRNVINPTDGKTSACSKSKYINRENSLL